MTIGTSRHQVSAKGPLSGIRVIDLSRLAPGPYCTALLADLGAEVIVVGGGRAGVPIPAFSRGKRFMSLDLKSDAGRQALHALVKSADVVVEGFRPGVADRLGAGYATLSALNPRLVYCSITGYGQEGPRARDAGHDINYIALSGLMASLGAAGQPPRPPLNLVADFAGGSLIAAVGVLAALLESRISGRGQHIDAAMLDSSLSLMAMHLPLWRTPHWPNLGQSLLDGSKPFYRSYACSDGKFVAVGALERGFFEALWQGLALGSEVPDHMSTANWPYIEARLTAAFHAQPREHWAKLFQGTDACVTPVLEPDEIWKDPHTGSRHPSCDAGNVPAIPRLSRTPASARPCDMADQTSAILRELGFDDAAIKAAVGEAGGTISGLEWPPPLH